MSGSRIIQLLKITVSAAAMIVVMAAIFSFSGQNGATSSEVSDSVAEGVLDILDKEVPPGQTASSVPIVAGLNIRKLAHLFLYMMLGLTSFLFTASLFGLKKRPFKLAPLYISLCALAICFAYACLDEMHQYFIDGRTASFGDVGIDSIGFTSFIILSCAAFVLITFIAKKIRLKRSQESPQN